MGTIKLMTYFGRNRFSTICEIDVNELPDRKLIATLSLEQSVKVPGDILEIENKSYITVEKTHHYYFDGVKYQFAKTTLAVKSLEDFC